MPSWKRVIVSGSDAALNTLTVTSGITGTLTGNASTSTTLQTSRTLTIGNTGKTFNGGANVAWSLSEIGAYASTNPSGFTSNLGVVASITTTGTSGASTLTSGVLNIPNYSGGSGTVTSVGGTGGYGGLTLTGTVTTSGNLTLGGTPTGTWPIAITGNSATTSAIAGTTNYISKFTSGTAIGNSLIYDNGTYVGIGTTSPSQKLDVAGNININTNGTNILISSYKGADSDGYNSFIGGGGQSSIGEGGATYKGANNSAHGFNALYSNTTGFLNSAHGANALRNNTTGESNSAHGALALRNNTIGTQNSAIGVNALYSNTTGNFNSAIGANALYSNTTGRSNSAHGESALYSNTTGNSNSAHGESALYYNTTGESNSAIGVGALLSNTTGNYITAIGVGALLSNTTGNFNSAIGANALYSNTTGYHNSAIGVNAGRSITTGNSNTFVGYSAGYHASQLIFAVNSMALGNEAYTTASNQVVIGNTSITQTLLNGDVGIGTTPTEALDVDGNVRVNRGASGGIGAILTLSNNIESTNAYTGINFVNVNSANLFRKAGIFFQNEGVGNGDGSIIFAQRSSFSSANATPSDAAMTIKSTKNVGIGTTTPTATLHIKAGTATAGTSPLKLTSGTLMTTPEAGTLEYLSNQFYIRGSDGLNVATQVTTPLVIGGTAADSKVTYKSTTGVGTPTGIAHQFVGGTDGATVGLTVLNNGFVGINKTNPTEALDVVGNLRLNNISTGIGEVGLRISKGIDATAVNRVAKIILGSSASNLGNNWEIKHASDEAFYNNGTLSFNHNQGGTFTNRFSIKSSGQVGIGQTTPTATLHIKAGTATAGTAPLKLTSGTVNTTAETGAIEYNNESLSFVRKASLRELVHTGGKGSVTLTADITTVVDARALTTSIIMLTATNLDGAEKHAFIDTKYDGSFDINVVNAYVGGETFDYLIIN